jgi:hypothetical protein
VMNILILLFCGIFNFHVQAILCFQTGSLFESIFYISSASASIIYGED